jgi:protein TonB
MMSGLRGASSEVWLRAVCLAASVGLHLGLVAAGWQGLGSVATDSAPIMVTLAAGPAAEAPPALGRSMRPAGPAVATPSPRPRQTPVPQVVAAAQPAREQADVVPYALSGPPVVAARTAMESSAAPAGEDPKGEAVADGAGALAATLSLGAEGGAGETLPAPGGQLILARPRYASNPTPEYPRLARQNRWEGVVYLRAAISAAGEVETVVVENSSGHQILDNSAVGEVRRWRFVPARRGDLRVPCEVRIPVAFQLAQ